MRAGVHLGRPRAIGPDYIGIDVNVAARLCEAAERGEILASERIRDELDGAGRRFVCVDGRPLRGVPSDLRLYRGSPRRTVGRSGR